MVRRRDDASHPTKIQLGLRVERDLRIRLKVAAARRNVTMEDLLHKILTRALRRDLPETPEPEPAAT